MSANRTDVYPMNSQKKAYLFAITAILLWSTVATAFKIALEYVSFLQLLFLSTTVALVSYMNLALTQKKFLLLFKVNKKQLIFSALNGFLNPFLYYVILLKAYSLLPAQVAQPLNYLWPVMLVLLSVPLLGQKLKLKSIISLFVGFIGVYIISTQGNIFGLKIESPYGVILAAGSSVVWALYWIFNKKNKSPEIVKLFWNFIFGYIYILIAMILYSDFSIPPLRGSLAVIYVGFFELSIPFFLWMKAMNYTKSNDKISNLVFLSPFLSLIFIYLILKEEIFYTTFVGISLILGGIFIQQIRSKKNK